LALARTPRVTVQEDQPISCGPVSVARRGGVDTVVVACEL
jgi:hypothetical protein